MPTQEGSGSHPLEDNQAEREYFAKLPRWGMGRTSIYRHAVIALSGSLPTWAQRAKPGPKPGGKPGKE